MKKKGILIEQQKKELEEKIKKRNALRTLPYVPEGSTFKTAPRIYSLTDPVQGGLDGAANAPIRDALDNAQFLYERIIDDENQIALKGLLPLPSSVTTLSSISVTSIYRIPTGVTIADVPSGVSPIAGDLVETVVSDTGQVVFQQYYKISTDANVTNVYFRSFVGTTPSAWQLLATRGWVNTQIANLQNQITAVSQDNNTYLGSFTATQFTNLQDYLSDITNVSDCSQINFAIVAFLIYQNVNFSLGLVSFNLNAGNSTANYYVEANLVDVAGGYSIWQTAIAYNIDFAVPNGRIPYFSAANNRNESTPPTRIGVNNSSVLAAIGAGGISPTYLASGAAATNLGYQECILGIQVLSIGLFNYIWNIQNIKNGITGVNVTLSNTTRASGPLITISNIGSNWDAIVSISCNPTGLAVFPMEGHFKYNVSSNGILDFDNVNVVYRLGDGTSPSETKTRYETFTDMVNANFFPKLSVRIIKYL